MSNPRSSRDSIFCLACQEISLNGIQVFSEIGEKWEIWQIIVEHLSFLNVSFNFLIHYSYLLITEIQ